MRSKENDIACDHRVRHCIRRCDPTGHFNLVDAEVEKEQPLSIYVNGEPLARLSCTDDHLEELIVGWLLSEGYVASLDEVMSLSMDRDLLQADVRLGRGRSNDHLTDPKQMSSVAPAPWTADEVFSMMEVFAQDITSHASTRGTHSAYLWQDGKLLCCREDVGRRGSFDKAIGFALLRGIDLSRCSLFTSGRVPADIAAKAIRSRIPMLVSKASTTDRAVELARNYRLTLICNARNNQIEIFNAPEAD